MVRSRFLTLTLISLCSVQIAQGALLKDTGRVIGGTAAGAACYGAVCATANAAKMLIWDGTFDASKLVSFSPEHLRAYRASAAAGFLIGSATTTYGRSLRAQWILWWFTSKDLIAIVSAEYEDDAQLTAALEKYYLSSVVYPLVGAKIVLSNNLNSLTQAAELIEAALEDLSHDAERARSYNAWLDDVYAIRAHIMYAANVIENDPRLPAMLDANTKLLEAQAHQNLATAHNKQANAQSVHAGAKLIEVGFNILNAMFSSK